MKLKASLLLNASISICPLILITEALRLKSSPSVASTALPKSFLLAFSMCCVTKAVPIHFIDGKCYISNCKV